MINLDKKGPIWYSEEITKKSEGCGPWKGWSLFKSSIDKGRKSQCEECGYIGEGKDALMDVTLTDEMIVIQAKKCPKCGFRGLRSLTLYKTNFDFWGDTD